MKLTFLLMNFTEITFEVILLGLAAFFLLIQIFYFVFFFFRLAFHKEQKIDSQSLPPISIIVAARSEAHNLVEFLPYLFEQNYPEFEVVVVNDRSWDDTKEILKAFQLKYSNLHVVNIEETNHKSNGKKMAVTLGIKGAKYEHLALTDADCKPVSQNWLMSIGMKFQNTDTKIVLGYSPFKKEKGFLNSLIRFDGFWVALQYLSFAKAGKPYMGVGRNLAYTKNDFFKIGGFKKHYNLKSGDDDLFVNEIANHRNTAVVLNEDSHVQTLPKTTWEHWSVQKKRHFTTAPLYKFSHRFWLSLWPLSLGLFYISVVLLLVLNKFLLITLVLLAVRTLFLILTFTRAGKWLGQKDIVWLAFFYEGLFLFIYPFLYLTGNNRKSEKWI